MHKSLLSFAVAMLAIAFTSFALADATYKFPDKDPTFSISFPDSWVQKDKDSSGYLEMGTPDDAIWIDIWVLDKSKDTDEANTIDDIDKDMASWLTNVDIHRAKDGDFTVGGLDFTSYSGTGKTKDGDVQDIEADICSPDGKSDIVICYYGDKGADQKYKADLATVFRSIKSL